MQASPSPLPPLLPHAAGISPKLQALPHLSGSSSPLICAAGINPEPLALCTFRSKKDIDKWRVFSDAAFGGGSSAALELGPDSKVCAVQKGHGWICGRDRTEAR